MGARLYRGMCERADDSGHVDLDACIEVSCMIGGNTDVVDELQEHLLIFNSVETAGWYVRLPVRRVEIASKIDT